MADEPAVQPFPVDPDLWDWLVQRAQERHRGHVDLAITAILRAARDADVAQRNNEIVGGSPQNPDRRILGRDDQDDPDDQS